MFRSSRLCRKPEVRTHDATMRLVEESEGESSHPQVRVGAEEEILERFTQHLADGLGATRADPEKRYEIGRLKALGATVFVGIADPTQAEAWMNLLKECFRVMRCPKDRKVTLVTFLLQKGAEDW